MSVITLAGEQLIATLHEAGQEFNVDALVLAKIPALDHTQPVDRAEGMPDVSMIKDQQPITKSGVVNDNTVVYSTVLGSEIGTYEFNWMGLYCSEHDTIVAIAYVPLQEKRATVGSVLGNVMTKNFATEYNGATAVTGITISAESWQVDYSARLVAMDLNSRNTFKRLWGESAFYGPAFKVFKDGASWKLTAGKALVTGLLIELEAEMQFVPDGTTPIGVYLNVYQKATMAGIENSFEILTTDVPPADYTAAGESHQFIKIAEITSDTDATDLREIAPSQFKLINGCLAVVME